MEWWQGNIFYEIFPASFQDSTGGDGIGDLRGIIIRLDYLKKLGVQAIRLNSIFPALHYPEYYSNINNIMDVNKELGTLEDFSILVQEIHRRNMSLILDLPLYPFVKSLNSDDIPIVKINETEVILRERQDNLSGKMTQESLSSTSSISLEINKDVLSSVPPVLKNSREETLSSNRLNHHAEHSVSKAIKIWQQRGVDGFYLKGLEHYVHESMFVDCLRYWKSLLHPNNILMCHMTAWNAANSITTRNSILSKIDLIDVNLHLSNGTKDIKAQIESITKGILFDKPSYPWIHWSIGSVDTSRVASTMRIKNASVAASLLSMMLPGTSNIFYGDEVL